MTCTGIVASSGVIGALSRNGAHEAALEQRQDLRRDAAADVDAGRRHRAQRQVAGFGAVGIDEQVHHRGAVGSTRQRRAALRHAGHAVAIARSTPATAQRSAP